MGLEKGSLGRGEEGRIRGGKGFRVSLSFGGRGEVVEGVSGELGETLAQEGA